MRNLVLVCFLFVIGSAAKAQNLRPNAIGLRLGGGDGFGTEISYQHLVGVGNRFELDLGLRDGPGYDAFKLTGIYHWVWNIEGGFNWFIGPGVGIGFVDYDPAPFFEDDEFVFATIEGQIGIEYAFAEIPLQLALDTRPAFAVIADDVYDDFDLDLALSIRFMF